MASFGGRCSQCGFDPPTVSPTDAAVAARSYPRRYRALLVRPDADDPDIVHRRPGPDQPSAADHAMAAAAGMDAAAAALHQVRVRDDPVVAIDPAPVSTPGGRAPALEAVLSRLDTAAAALAAGIDAVHGDEWERAGHVAGGARAGALDLARAGVHAGTHHLRAAERTIALVR